jgi:SAM-dependent methyltransferase
LVEAYYEANSRRFLRYGQGAGSGTIHRAVWGPGVTNQVQAFDYVNELILQKVRSTGAEVPRVIDLGCGIGATLTYLAKHGPVAGLGVTLSGTQVALAEERFRILAPHAGLRVMQGTFLDVPEPAGSFDVAFAIEAFAHTDSPRQFFAEAVRLLKPGGLLLICDDLRVASEKQHGPTVERWLLEVRKGWQLNCLSSVDELREFGGGLQLVEQTDLTPYLELNRPRDWLIRGLVAVGRHLPLSSPWWGNLLGGNALQRCLQAGVLEHRFLVFQRPVATV